MERLTPAVITRAERDAAQAAQAERDRKARVIAKLRENGYEFRDDLDVLAEAIRYLYQESGITPPQPLVEWWQAFQAAEDEIDQEAQQ